MCCTIHSFPYHNIISAFRCPELERTRALWWCLLWSPPILALFSSFYIRDTGQTGAADVPICSPMQNDLLLQAPPPFLASISSDCRPCGSLWAFKEAQRKEEKEAQNKVEADSWRGWEPPVDSVPDDPTGISDTWETEFGWSGKTKLFVGAFISTCLNADVSKGQILYSLQLPAESMVWKYELGPINTVKHLHLDLFVLFTQNKEYPLRW